MMDVQLRPEPEPLQKSLPNASLPLSIETLRVMGNSPKVTSCCSGKMANGQMEVEVGQIWSLVIGHVGPFMRCCPVSSS